MNTQQLAEQFIDALHTLEDGTAEDTAALIEMYADDTLIINAALKLAGQDRRGREGAAQFWREYRGTFGKARSEFFQITTNNESAGLFWTTKGTDNDGNPLEYDGVSLLVFNDQSKITLFRGYYDTRELSRQVRGEG